MIRTVGLSISFAMLKKLLAVTIISCLLTGAYLACGDGANGPDESLEFKEFGVNNPTSMFGPLGIDLTNLQAYFFVDWTDEIDFAVGAITPVIRTFARAFESRQSANSFDLRGVDMGDVTFFQIDGDSVTASISLAKVSHVIVGFDYRAATNQVLGPGSTVNFRFVPGGSYRFTRLGAGDVDSLSIDFSGPSDSLSITRPVMNTPILQNDDLRIEWRGGVSTERVAVLIQPMFEFRNGRGFSPGVAEFLTSNPGEFTLPASSVQALLDNAATELANEPAGSELIGIFVYVALPNLTEVSQDGDRSIVIALTSDQLFLPLPLGQ